MSVFSSSVLQDRIVHGKWPRYNINVDGGHTKCASMSTKITCVPPWLARYIIMWLLTVIIYVVWISINSAWTFIIKSETILKWPIGISANILNRFEEVTYYYYLQFYLGFVRNKKKTIFLVAHKNSRPGLTFIYFHIINT